MVVEMLVDDSDLGGGAVAAAGGLQAAVKLTA